MVQYRIVDEYENGCAAIRGRDSYYARTEDGQEIEMGNSSIVTVERRTRLYAALRVQLGAIALIEDQDLIPVDVAVAGKPVIAAYLYVAHWNNYSTEPERRHAIAARLGVGYSTITKYLRRVLKQAAEQRVGGVGR